MAEQSIKSLFASAERQRLQIESAGNSNTTAYQENLAAAITNYHDCLQLADRISLFSPNETLEDLTSGDLQYLLINYHLAELILRVAGNDRKLILRKAREIYEEFLTLLYQYELLNGPHKKFYNQYLEAPTTFSTISTIDGASLRNTKMANHALELELKKKLQFLSQNPAYLQQDDDAVRDVQLANIAFCTHNAFQQLEFINKEADILAMAPPTPPTGPDSQEIDHRQRMGGLRDNKEYSDKLDFIPSNDFRSQLGPERKDGSRPVQGMVKVFASEEQRSRQQRTKDVFRSGHNPPTMTLDEYAEYEKANMIEGGGEASGRSPTPDEDNHEKGDEETYKARNWDLFTEDNPKGSGNTLNRG